MGRVAVQRHFVVRGESVMPFLLYVEYRTHTDKGMHLSLDSFMSRLAWRASVWSREKNTPSLTHTCGASHTSVYIKDVLLNACVLQYQIFASGFSYEERTLLWKRKRCVCAKEILFPTSTKATNAFCWLQCSQMVTMRCIQTLLFLIKMTESE